MAGGISDFENQLKSNMQDSFPETQSRMSNQQLNTTITETMRSFKDQMAFNLQSLNLTLSTLSSSMNNLGTKIGSLTPNSAGRYIEAGLQPGSFLGNISRNYANAQGQFVNSLSAIVGDSAFIHRPYNINPMEFYTGAHMQRDFYAPKLAANVLSGVIGAVTPGSTLSTMALSGFWQGTHSYMDTGDMIRRMSGRFGTGVSNQNGALAVARGIQRLSNNEIMTTTSMDNRLGYSGFKDIAALGLQTDMFHGKSPDELLKQIKEAGKVVKLLTGVLGAQDVQEAMQSLTQMKNMGLNLTQEGGAKFTKNLVQNSFGYGFNNGMTSGQMLNAGMQISQAGLGTYSIPAAIGVQQGMQNLAYMSEMRKRGLISDASIAAGGGEQAMAAKMMGVTGSIMSSPFGASIMAAGFTGSGFSSEQALKAMQNGGFVGTVGSGISRMFGGRGFFANSARMMVDRTDMLASLAQQDPRALQNMTDTALRMQLGFNPIYNSGNMKDKMYMVAQHLMRTQNMDADSAKAIASRFVDPSIMRSADYAANLSSARAEIDRGRVYNSAGAQISRAIIDPLERLGQKMVVQPFVKLGETVTNFAKRREQYSDFAAAARRGNDAIYDTEYDAQGNPTGVKTLNMEKLESQFSRIGKEAYDEDMLAEDAVGSQLIHAQNNIVNGGKGTLGRSLLAKTWNKAGQMLTLGYGQDYTKDARIYTRMLNRYKNTYKKEFSAIDDGYFTDSTGKKIETMLSGESMANYARERLGNTAVGRSLHSSETTELADTYENNPLAYSLAIASKMGVKADFDYNSIKVDEATQKKAQDYFAGHEFTAQNVGAFGLNQESFFKDLSGYLSYMGANTTAKRKQAVAAFLRSKTVSGMNAKDLADKYGKDVIGLLGTDAGNDVLTAFGTGGGANTWQSQEFFGAGTSKLNTDDIFSTEKLNQYEIMTQNGYDENMGKVFSHFNGLITKDKDKKNGITQSDWNLMSKQQRAEYVQKVTGLNSKKSIKMVEDIAKVQEATGLGNFSDLANRSNLGKYNDALQKASEVTGGVLSKEFFNTEITKTGSIGGALTVGLLDNADEFKKKLYGFTDEDANRIRKRYDDLISTFGIKELDEEGRTELLRLGRKAEGKNEEEIKADKERIKADTEAFMKKHKIDPKLTAENIQSKVQEMNLANTEEIYKKEQLANVQESQNKAALEQSVKTAIDSTVATINGKRVVLIVDAAQYVKDIKEDRDKLSEKIEQVSANSLGWYDEYVKGKSNKVHYSGGSK